MIPLGSWEEVTCYALRVKCSNVVSPLFKGCPACPKNSSTGDMAIHLDSCCVEFGVWSLLLITMAFQ